MLPEQTKVDDFVEFVETYESRLRHALPTFPSVPEVRTPWFEPALPAALAALPERERTVVLLLHEYGWHMTEVAKTLGVAKSTAQTHAERGMRKLRRKLGVER